MVFVIEAVSSVDSTIRTFVIMWKISFFSCNTRVRINIMLLIGCNKPIASNWQRKVQLWLLANLEVYHCLSWFVCKYINIFLMFRFGVILMLMLLLLYGFDGGTMAPGLVFMSRATMEISLGLYLVILDMCVTWGPNKLKYMIAYFKGRSTI